jgi:hypothetical protein
MPISYKARWRGEANSFASRLGVLAQADGRKHLRTDPGKTTENNLLSLPRCS